MTIFFYLCLLSSCDNFFQNTFGCLFNLSDNEDINLLLPAWPPDDSCNKHYPDLSCWLISIESENYSEEFIYTPSDKITRVKAKNGSYIEMLGSRITLNVKKNRPAAVTAQPVTKIDDLGRDVSLFFRPAGLIYPFEIHSPEESCKGGRNKSTFNKKYTYSITWNEGFIATVMEHIFRNKSYTKSQLSSFISSFNWKKAAAYINEQIEGDAPYNPWLLNMPYITNKICTKEVSASCFSLSSTESIDISLLNIPDNTICPLSSFIPENKDLLKTKKILVKKQQPLLIYTSENTGIICTYSSINKISLEYILLPIYIRGI